MVSKGELEAKFAAFDGQVADLARRLGTLEEHFAKAQSGDDVSVGNGEPHEPMQCLELRALDTPQGSVDPLGGKSCDEALCSRARASASVAEAPVCVADRRSEFQTRATRFRSGGNVSCLFALVCRPGQRP